MKPFWGACVVGFIMAGGLAVGAEPRPAAPGGAQTTRYAYFEVDGSIRETLPPVYLFGTKEKTLHDILGDIAQARADSGIRGLIVRVGEVDAGWAKVQDIRDALMRCRLDGKEVVSVLEGGSNMSYYLATAGSRIVLLPSSQLMLVGLRAEAIFAKGLLDKIGVKGDFVEVGKYKGAAEPLTRTTPSPAFRESLEATLDDYYEQLLDGISEGRGIPATRADALVKGGPYTAQQARDARLVDDVMFYDQLLDDLKRAHDGKIEVQPGGAARPTQAQKASSVNLFQLLMGGLQGKRATAAGPTIVVLYAVGPIMTGEPEGFGVGEEVVGSGAFIKLIRRVADDENVKAIVLRVDSPGGSAQASDEIWRQLRLADAKKPVIASLSDVAASGGYYIAAGCRAIYSEPGSLTGSIGVFGGKVVLSGLFEKIGLNVIGIDRGGRADIDSLFREYSPDERRKVEDLIQDTYRLFLARVAETRTKMEIEEIDKVAQGRIWTGNQAHKNGLVESLGGLGQAIEAAKKAAGMPAGQPVEIMYLPQPRNLLEYILSGGDEDVRFGEPWGAVALPRALAPVRPYIRALMALESEVSVCMLPAVIRIR
jgi:protease-4